MPPVTPFTSRMRQSLRTDLLDAAADLLPTKGASGLRMAEVATRAGVSRQTIYNEFGNKDALVQAVSDRIAEEFLLGMDTRLRAQSDPVTGMRTATRYTLDHARENPLVTAMLTSPAAADLLPYVTTKGAPLIRSATEITTRYLRERLPQLSEHLAALLAESASRLVLSHLVLPTSSP
ncbi:MAG: TetR/AcrR family transcriptional regulator, partial [Sciscionella sp.]